MPQASPLALRPQKYAPASGEADDASDDEIFEDASDDVVSSRLERGGGGGDGDDASSAGSLPLMRVFDPSYAASPAPSREVPRREDSDASSVVRFAVTVSEASFEAGALEAVEGTLCLVDLGGGPERRRKLTEDAHFAWGKGEAGGSSGDRPLTAVFALPARTARSPTIRALVRLTHLSPHAGGVDAKMYTRKTPKEIAKHLAAEQKRVSKTGPKPPGTFAHDVPPRQIVAWATLPVALAREHAVDKAFRVKETHSESAILEAASSASSHPMKSHKPVRVRLAIRVSGALSGSDADVEAALANAPRVRCFEAVPHESESRWWWDRCDAPNPPGAAGEASRLGLDDGLGSLSRDAFVYVDAVGFGRRKDCRVRVQLREDDLDIDGPGAPAMVAAVAGGETKKRGGGEKKGGFDEDAEGGGDPGILLSEDDGASSDADARDGDDPEAAGRGFARGRSAGSSSAAREAWTPLSSGKAKGGAWSFEAKVRLPVRLRAGHHLVFSVYGREPEPVGGGWGSLLAPAPGPEQALGHAVLPLASAEETLSEEAARSRFGAALERGGDVALPAVKELLPKYLQANVKNHMPYWEDRKPCVSVRLRVCSNAHTACAKLGALYAALRAAREADDRASAEETDAKEKNKPGAVSISMHRRGASLGAESSFSRHGANQSAVTRSAVKSAARGLRAALAHAHAGDGGELLRHFPAIAHALLSLVAAPPPHVASAVDAESALVASAARAKAAAKAAERVAAAAKADAAKAAAAVRASAEPSPGGPGGAREEGEGEGEGEGSGSSRAADDDASARTPARAGGDVDAATNRDAATPFHTPAPPAGRAKTLGGGDPGAKGGHSSASPESDAWSETASTNGGAAAARSTPGSAAATSGAASPPPPATPASASSFSATPAARGSSPESAAAAASGTLAELAGAAAPRSPAPPPKPPGLREIAFVALVRVAARAQRLAPGDDAARTRSPPLKTYAARAFDDARISSAKMSPNRGDAGLADDADANDAGDSSGGAPAMFPELARLHAACLRGHLGDHSADAARDAREATWFVFALIARSVATDAARRRFRGGGGVFDAAAEDASCRDGAEDLSASEAANGERHAEPAPFAAAPPGAAAPEAGDARFAPVRDLAAAVAAETCDERACSLELRRRLNLDAADLFADLERVVGPVAWVDPEPDALGGGRANRAGASSSGFARRGGSLGSVGSSGPSALRAAKSAAENRRRTQSAGASGSGGSDDDRELPLGSWSRRGDGPRGDFAAPLAPLARGLAAAHLRMLLANARGAGSVALLYEFYRAVASSPRFVSVGAATVLGTGWAWRDVSAEEAARESSELAAAKRAEAAGTEGPRDRGTEDGAPSRRADDSSERDAPLERSSSEHAAEPRGDALVTALADATLAGLRSTDPSRRVAAAAAFSRALAHHAWDARLQSSSARAAVAASLAPLLRLVVSHRDEIVPGLARESKRQVLAAFLSLARDADQAELWAWLSRDPSGNGMKRRPPRLVAFLTLARDALETFEAAPISARDRAGAPGQLSAAATLAVIAIVREGTEYFGGPRAMSDHEDLAGGAWEKRPRSTLSTIRGRAGGGGGSDSRGGGLFGGGKARRAREASELRALRLAARAVSPATVFFEGSMGVLLAAMRRPQSVAAWRALSPLMRGLLWDHRESLLAPLRRGGAGTGTRSSARDAGGPSSPPEPFPPEPAPEPGEKPYPFLEKASTCLLRVAASPSPALRAEASACLRALLEAALDAAGAVTVLRPMLTYAVCAALYAPLGDDARRGALAGELAKLREPAPEEGSSRGGANKEGSSGGNGASPNNNGKARGGGSVARGFFGSALAGASAGAGWARAAGATVQALESAEASLRELARAAAGPEATPDVETVVDMECAVAAALSWAPAAHCKALRSLSARLEEGSHWVEAAEAAATAAGVAMRALAAAPAVSRGGGVGDQANENEDDAESDGCVWSASDVAALSGARASLGGDGASAFGAADGDSADASDSASAAASSRCGVEEISEEKVLAHLAEATRLFVKGGHLEAAAVVAKTALPAWERRRAFGDLARAHAGIAGVYRALHQLPPAGTRGSGAFGSNPPPPPGPPPPPATFYRVRLVGKPWGPEWDGKAWIHREPMDRSLGDMLRRVRASLAGARLPEGHDARRFPDLVRALPLGEEPEDDEEACVQIIAVEPRWEAAGAASGDEDEEYEDGEEEEEEEEGGNGAKRSDAPEGSSVAEKPTPADAGGARIKKGASFPTASSFVFDVPFVRSAPDPAPGLGSDSDSGGGGRLVRSAGSGPLASLRTTWRRRTAVRTRGRFPGLRARLEVASERSREMSPAASAAEMLRAQARAVSAAADAWERLVGGGRGLDDGAGAAGRTPSSSAVVGGVGGGAHAALDDLAAANAAAGALGALQRSLQGSLSAGVNGGVPTICRAFFPECYDDGERGDAAEEGEGRDRQGDGDSVSGAHSGDASRGRRFEMTDADRAALEEALDAFQGTCARAVEVHGRAARRAANEGTGGAGRPGGNGAAASSMEQMQGMFVRCVNDVRREIARITLEVTLEGGGGGERKVAYATR